MRIGGAWTTHHGKRLKIHRAHVEDGRLVPDVVQPEGKAAMPAADWARGARWRPGDPLGT